MVWGAGVCVIWLPGYTRNTASLLMFRWSAGRYGLWVTGSYRRDHVIMPKTPRRGRYLRKTPNPSGGNQEQAPGWNDHRNLVARRGQGRAKTKTTRRWAKRGARPSAPKDQRTRSVYIFGAICLARSVGAALIHPRCNTAAMILHLQKISVAVAPGAHAIVIVDQAGWHFSKALEIPDNITLLPLPVTWPELNPVENTWQFMRDNCLSNRIFKSKRHC